MADRVIFKYEVSPRNGHQVDLQMPAGAEILHVAEQATMPTIWAIVDRSQPMVTRKFLTIFTGDTFNVDGLAHIGTCIGCGFHRGLVLHIFEVLA